jgi:hypothetical protein
MWEVEYFTTRNDREPAAEWIDALAVQIRAQIYAKIDKLREHGLELLNTEMLKVIVGSEEDLYELRSGQGRIALFYDRRRDVFVLLNGWLKKKQRQPRDIETARRNSHEYLSTHGR